MEKIVSFEQDEKFYLNLSKKCRDKGDYAGAIDYAKRAVALPSGTERARLELAELYLDANLYDKVLDVLNEILARNRRCVPAYRLAFHFFLNLDDVYSLLSYIKFGLDYNGDNEEYFELLDEFRREFDFGKMLADSPPQGYRQIYPESAPSEELLEHFDKNEFFFAESRTHLAQSAMEAGDFRAAEAYLKEVLEEEPENISALCGMVYLCNLRNRYGDAQRYVEKLLQSANLTDVNDAYKIVSVFCDLNRHELVLDALETIEEVLTLDDRLLNIKALALYNLRRLPESEEVFRLLRAVDDTFHIYSYYLKWVHAVRVGEREFEPLEYTDQVPESEYQYRGRRLEVILSLPREDFLQCLKVPENVELLEWSLTMNEDEIVTEAIKALFRSPHEYFLDEMLIYSDMSYSVKKEIVALKLFREDEEICYTISDLIKVRQSRFPKRYREFAPPFRRAFCMAQGVLYFTDKDYYRKLCMAAGRMFDRWKAFPDADFEDEEALTATLLSLTVRKEYPREALMRIFHLTESTLSRYLDFYETQKK